MVGRKQFVLDDAVEAAMRVFWERGYNGASVQHLAAATGVSRSSLYGTFGDKEALFLRSLEHYGSTVAAGLLAALRAHPGDPRAAVGAMFDAILRRMADASCPSGCLITLSAGECGTLPPAARKAVRRQLAGQVRAVRAVIEDDVPADRVPHAGPPQALADALVGTAQTLALLHRAGTGGTVLRSVADTALHVLEPVRPAASGSRSPH
ncbi:MAG: TetR/AcrR family transcriptional regulator [Phycicoccus sp.]